MKIEDLDVFDPVSVIAADAEVAQLALEEAWTRGDTETFLFVTGYPDNQLTSFLYAGYVSNMC